MSDNQGQSEPSMEEILASIRRIISEEDSDEAKAPLDPAAPAAEGDPEEAPGEGEGDEDDVLELTEQDALPEEEPDAVLELEEADALPEDREPEVPPEPAPAPEPEPEPDLEPEAAAPFAVAAEAEVAAREVAPDAADEDAAYQEAGDEDAGDAEAGGRDVFEAAAAPDHEEAGEPAMSDRPHDGLVSASTAAATTAALSELTRRRRVPASTAAPSGGESIEAFVARLLEPHLRDWLDENLEPLVERVVREEVRRLARRAEDD